MITIYPSTSETQRKVSLINMAQRIIELTASSSKITFHPLPVDDPKQRRPDISKAQTILDWKPEVSRTRGFTKDH